MKKIVNLKKEKEVKTAVIGFSWTTFFFGFFVPLFRKDWIHAIIFAVISFIVTLPIKKEILGIENQMMISLIFLAVSVILGVIFGFVYNRLYINGLLKKGWSSERAEDEKLLIENKFLSESRNKDIRQIRKEDRKANTNPKILTTIAAPKYESQSKEISVKKEGKRKEKLFFAGSIVGAVLLGTAALFFFLKDTEFNFLRKDNGNTVVINMNEEPVHLDSRNSNINVNGNIILGLLIEGATREKNNGEIVPALAESVEHSSDMKVWKIHLRKGIKWSNGEPIKAKDFLDGWSEDTGDENKLEDIKNENKILDDHTIEITLEKPLDYIDVNLSRYIYAPLNKKFFDKMGKSYGTTPKKTLYSGPYMLKEWKKGEEIVLVKNPHYWDKENIKVDKIIFRFLSTDKATEAFGKEEMDVTLVKTATGEKMKADPRIIKVKSGYNNKIDFNTEQFPFNNAKIRKAIVMAIKKDKNDSPKTILVSEKLDIMGLNKKYTDELPDYTPKYNPEEARKLLKEGMKELGIAEFPQMHITTSKGMDKKFIDEIIKKLQENLGIEALNDEISLGDMMEKRKKSEFSVIIASWLDTTADLTDLYITPLYNSNYNNSEYKKLINEVITMTDRNKKLENFKKMDAILAQDLPSALLYYYSDNYYIVNPRIKGLTIGTKGEQFSIRDIYVEK